MLLLFGVRRRGQSLGVLMWTCSRCGVQTAHRYTIVKNWFTLFFIPLIPLPTQHKLVCMTCGTQNKFKKSDQPAIAEAARAGAARAAAIAAAAAQTPGGPMAPLVPNVSYEQSPAKPEARPPFEPRS
ncbi:MAG TPA: zinc-ribbon domain-containing protein [Acidimicrobiales bacterium]|jgi:hypothetical protein|nr:zinc-ribbon domain-containing protein [Acidimicrobiales bacterium]